jgi:outer membrane protein TolC
VRGADTEAEGHYRSKVLTVFQNVAGMLNAHQQDADALKAAAAAKNAAAVTLDLTEKQYQTGYQLPELLNAEQSYQQALINLVQSQANR